MSSRGPGRYDYTAGNDHFHGRINAHIQLRHLGARDDHQVPGRGIERTGYVNAAVLSTQFQADFGNVLRGHEPDAPDARPRVLNHHDLAERVRLRKDAFGKALDPAVDAPDDRNPVEKLFPEGNQLPTHEVR